MMADNLVPVMVCWMVLMMADYLETMTVLRMEFHWGLLLD